MIIARQSVPWNKKWVWSFHFLSGIRVQVKGMSCVWLNKRWKRSSRIVRLCLVQHHNLPLLNHQPPHTLNSPRLSPLVLRPLPVARLVHQVPPQVHPDNINTIKYQNGLLNLIKKEIYGNWRVRSVYGRCECSFFSTFYCQCN